MRNSHVMLLGVIGFLLARQGVDGSRQCYDCHACPQVDASTDKTTCSASCMATITCQNDKENYVTRTCSIKNVNTSCITSDNSKNTYHCYCNEENCDALAVKHDICDSSAGTVASLAILLFAFLPAILLM